jgi:hypothetical protein
VVAEWAGLESNDPLVYVAEFVGRPFALSSLNDGFKYEGEAKRLTFPEIADIIEKEL